jgi:hypothetical protein
VEWAGAGPPMAHVEHVEVEVETPQGESGFRIR